LRSKTLGSGWPGLGLGFCVNGVRLAATDAIPFTCRNMGLERSAACVETKSIAEFEAAYPFELDGFQSEAIRHLAAGKSVLVAAPTGTGKTVVAEYGVFRAYWAGRRSIYTTPIKALSNQKYRDLRRCYGEDVGLMTGDVVENPQARILVMTTEVLRNILLQTPGDLDDVACVVFDEIHYLSDPERGTVWEEAIICCPPHVQLVCLSATVSNAGEVAAWLASVHGEIELVVHRERTVPLEHYYYLDGQLNLFLDASGRQVRQFPGVGGESRRALRLNGWRENRQSQGQVRPEPAAPEVVQKLKREGLLPCIYFLFSRRDTEVAAENCAGHVLAEGRAREQIVERVRAYLDRLAPEDRRLRQVQMLAWLLPRGVAFHHAGMLPVLKVLVEELFNAGLIGVVFATDTLALGINMPAKTVVVGAFTKYDGESRRPLIPNEYQQLTGRAGRRGMDARGVAVVPYSPWVAFDEVAAVARGELLPIRSAFNLRYNTVLNLWGADGLKRVVGVASKSLRQFQIGNEISGSAQTIRQLGREIEDAKSGCLLGGPDVLDEYDEARRLAKRTNEQLERQRKVWEALRDAQARAEWSCPSKGEVKQSFRRFRGGEFVHTRQHGWGIFIRRTPESQEYVALGLFGKQALPISSYGDVDYLPSPTCRVVLPATLAELPQPTTEASAVVSNAEWEALEAACSSAPLPDLEALREARARQVAPRVAEAEFRLRETEARLEELEAAIEASPCHGCEVRSRHRELRRRQAELQMRRDEVTRDLHRQQEQQRAEVERVVRDLVAVLEHFDYLKEGYPTRKAAMLRDIFDTNGLVICELISRRYLARLSAAEVAEVFSWFAYDRELTFANRHTLSGALVSVRERLAALESEVLKVENRHQLDLSRSRNPSFFGIAYAWANGASLGKLLEKVSLSEGDIILALNKTLDLLRQVGDMLRRADPLNPLREKVREAERLLRRGIVEQCYLLATPAGDLLLESIRDESGN